MGDTRSKEIFRNTKKSKEQNGIDWRIYLLYFVISYSTACLIVMTYINCKDFVEIAASITFVFFMLVFLQMATTFELPGFKNKSQSKIVPQDCEKGSILSIPNTQKYEYNTTLPIISSGIYLTEKHSFNVIKMSDDIAQVHILP